MEKRMGHTGIEHIFTCIYIDKHTYIYLYRGLHVLHRCVYL